MAFELSIPRTEAEPLSISMDIGDYLFIIGANGTGKSSLIHLFYQSQHNVAQRISAHRQTWFNSNALTLSANDKRNTEQNIHSVDNDAQSRWKEEYSAQRTSIAIYNLIDAENVRARHIANAVDQENLNLAQELSKKDAPIKIINELLQLSNIPIKISVGTNDAVVASKSEGQSYSIAELSDGERNALLIAANVLTVKPGTLLLIDEPERHLHRSIISPLLTLLFEKRSDCSFVVSTHDVMLPLDNPGAQTVLVRGCAFNGPNVTSWDVDLIPSESTIDESLKRDILGSRRKILFIESDERSLDKPIYSLVFPNVSIITKSSCRDVEQAVSGIRGSSDLHWLHAFGIIDNDRRTEDDILLLKQKGIYAVSVYAVESIYYHPTIQQLVIERHTKVTGEDASVQLIAAKNAAFLAVIPHIQRLSERAVEKTLRDEFDKRRPTQRDITKGESINVTIDVATVVNEERNKLQTLINKENLEEIISRYPIRETPALTEISKKLGFQERRQYENSVRKLLMDDVDALKFVRSLFDTLELDIAAD